MKELKVPASGRSRPVARVARASTRTPLPRSPRAIAEDWRVLRSLALYRLVLLTGLLVAEETGYAPHFFDHLHISLFHAICVGYAIVALLVVLMVYRERPALPRQVPLQYAVDAAGVALLVYACGGVGSGMGALLITPMVGYSLISTGRTALITAAMATALMFGEEILRVFQLDPAPIDFTATGILGLIYFGANIAGNAAARRTRRSEALAVRTGNDLASLSELNSRIIETMETGVVVLNPDRTLRLYNNASRKLLNLGASGVGAWLPQVAPRLDAALTRWRRGEIRDDPMLTETGGEELVPRFTNLGSQTDAPILILLDAATQLREQAQQMKLAALGRLSAGIAHEIRNPLSAIQQAEQLLAESENLDEQDRRMLQIIARHSTRLERIVQDVLGLSRREAISRSQINLKSWLERGIALYQEAHPDRAQNIEVLHVDDGLDVRFDPTHLQQIVHNLWDNSFDHGGRDGHSITVRLRAYRMPSTHQPCLETSDDGAGIPQAVVDKIFEPFFTTAGGTTGTGLGLYLARELCEYNRGRLYHQPSERGATFRIVFASA